MAPALAHLSRVLDDLHFWPSQAQPDPGAGIPHLFDHGWGTSKSSTFTSFAADGTRLAATTTAGAKPNEGAATKMLGVPGSVAAGGAANEAAKIKTTVPLEEKLPRNPSIRIDMLNNNNSQYYGDFMLGTPPQPFTAVMDTGSGLIWVPGKKCDTEVCQEHHQYDEGASSTKHAIPSEIGATTVIHYGTGSVHYQQSEDTLRLCDSKLNPNCRNGKQNILTIPSQTMGTSLTQTAEPFKWLPFDGIFGLAPSASKGSALYSIKKAKVLAHNLLGCYLSEDTHRTGSMSFGGIEPQYIAKGHPLYWHDSTHDKEWQVAISDFEINGERQHVCDGYPDKECLAVVDTGSSLVTGPMDLMDPMMKKMKLDTTCKQLEKMPRVDILIKGNEGTVRYPLTPQEYTLADVDEEDKPVCELGFGGMDVPGRKWVLGDTFLRRYYSIYDDDNAKMGFVRSVHPGEVNPPAPRNLLVAKEDKALSRVAVASMPAPEAISLAAAAVNGATGAYGRSFVSATATGGPGSQSPKNLNSSSCRKRAGDRSYMGFL